VRPLTETNPRAGGSARPGILLRELSEQAVLEVIFRDGPITRTELAERTNLSKPTVADAVRRLMRERLIRSAGVRSGNLGRSPVSYVVDEAAGCVIGVDVGGSNIRVAAVNLYGELLSTRTVPHRLDGGRTLAQQVQTLVREMARTIGATHSHLLAIGASATPSALAQPAEDDPFSLLRQRSDVPVLVDNSVNLSAVGEKWRGFATEVSDFAFVSVGAGVGVGIVVADELVRGAHRAAGNIGSLPAVLKSPNNSGAFVPIGAMDAASVLEEAALLRWKDGAPKSIADLFARLDSEPSARRVVLALAGRVAFVVASICAMLDPELVVLGGGIGSLPQLLDPVRAAVADLLTHPVPIESSLLHDEAALYGALASGLRDARDQLFRRGTRLIETRTSSLMA
jgi:predicted NBD/HSP70 family sugar kinase